MLNVTAVIVKEDMRMYAKSNSRSHGGKRCLRTLNETVVIMRMGCLRKLNVNSRNHDVRGAYARLM